MFVGTKRLDEQKQQRSSYLGTGDVFLLSNVVDWDQR